MIIQPEKNYLKNDNRILEEENKKPLHLKIIEMTNRRESMIQIGEVAPDFSLPNQDTSIVRLSDYQGKKVVVYFYLNDDTPGCTKEACSFRDRYQDFLKKEAVILGISCDLPKSHQSFIEKFNIPFQLLSDSDTKIANKWGVYGEKNVYGRKFMGIHRTTFIIDEHGKVAHVFKKVAPSTHAREVLNKL